MENSYNPDVDQILYFAGLRGELTERDRATARARAAEVRAVACPKAVARRFPLERTARGIAVSGSTLVLTGADIAAFLEGCADCLLFAATLGAHTDELLRKAQIEDMSRAILLDAAASALIEAVCDDLCKRLAESCETTEGRFSPGYGDLPIELQRTFLAVLDAPRAIGLCVNESCLMTPAKSVTAIVGIK